MKKMFFALMMLATTISAKAMSYEQARNEALFLTDKMAYELNLTEEQYEAAYEINLDYLMGVTGRADVFGTYWERRNLDMSYILYDWQWNAFVAATYFYRPLYWEAGYWHFGIYLRYPHRDYFYFGYPHFYVTYRGGHAWHRHGGHGYYHGHSHHYRPHHNDHHVGMHDRWDRGDYRGSRNSSTRVTGSRHNDRNHRDGGSGNFNGRRDGQQNRIGNQSHSNHQPHITEGSRSSHNTRGGFSGRSHSTESRSSGSFSSGPRNGGSRSSGSFSSGPRSGGSHSSSTRGGYSGRSHSGGFSSSSHSSGSRGGFSGGSHGGGSHGGGSHGGGSHGHGGHR